MAILLIQRLGEAFHAARTFTTARTIWPVARGKVPIHGCHRGRASGGWDGGGDGREVIHIERPSKGEDWREAELPISGPTGEQIASSWIQDRRNTYYTTLDFSTTEGQEMFLKAEL